MAQEYTVEQLNHGRKVYDFMRWDYWAFGISGLLLIAAIVIMGVRGFNWGLDFTGGTVIEITLEKPAEIDVMRDALQKAGFEEPMLQNFGSSHDIMVRMPPAEGETGGQVLGSQVLKVINESTNQNAAVKRIEFVGPSVGADLAQTGAMALMAALLSILNNPEDGSNWELLCLYCHDHEHSKYTEADQYGTTVIAGEDAQKDVGEAKYNPFADLKAMMNKKK